MWRVTRALIRKDLSLLIFRGSALLQALLLGLLLIFVFSLAQSPGELLSPQSAATIFWMSSLFCQVLLFNQLYALEESCASRIALCLLPVPVQAVWLAKTVSGLILLLCAQLFFLPALILFLGQNLSGNLWQALLGVLLVDTGISALGSLLGAVAQGQVSRESLLSILVFPLLTPLLLAGISIHAATFGGSQEGADRWIPLAAAFDAIFLSAACFLFSFIYTGDDA